MYYLRVVLGIVLSIVLFTATIAHAGPLTEWAVGSSGNLLTTELNSIANNGFTAAGSAYDNRQGQTGNGYTLCRIEGVFTFGANPTANTAVIVWFLRTIDGTNYENTPTASVGLGRPPDVVLPVTSGQTGTRVMIDTVCPAERFKAVAQNSGTGQTLAASGNTVKILPLTFQGN